MIRIEFSTAESLVLIAAITTLDNEREIGAVLKSVQEKLAVSVIAYDPLAESAVRALLINRDLKR